MKRVLRGSLIIAILITLILGFLNLVGTITTKWNWVSFSMFLTMIFMINERFVINKEENKTKSSRAFGVILILAAILNLLAFIKSGLK